MKKSSLKSSHKLSQYKRKKQKDAKKRLKNRLSSMLSVGFGWKKSTSSFTAGIICNILAFGKVQQKDLIRCQETENKKESNMRFIQRFFKKQHFDFRLFSMLILSEIKAGGKVTILIDRTNWDFGKKHINILVASVLFEHDDVNQRFSIPLVWEVFDKKGNSNTQERKNLMEQLFKIVGKENIKEVLADREFIGSEWIAFLHENSTPFVLRIKKNRYVIVNKKKVQIQDLAPDVKKGESVSFDIILDNIPMKLSITKSVENDLVAVIASKDIQDPLSEYRLRWLIELFFKSIKSKGFNFEDTHMTDPESIKKLFTLTALATLLSVKAGAFKHSFMQKIPIKNHGRPTFSLFTYGLDFIRDMFDGAILKFKYENHNFELFQNYDFHLRGNHDLTILNYALREG